MTIREIDNTELAMVAGGQMDPQSALCITTKLEVKSVVNEPMFDMHASSWALYKTCPMLFPTNFEAEMYIQELQALLPPGPPMP